MERVEKPWGYELRYVTTDRYAGKVLFIKAGSQLSLQYHEVKDETILVQSGTLAFEVGGEDGKLERVELGPGEVYRITPGTRHRMIGVTDVDIVEVSTPELDDVVRLEDRYGREGTSKP